MPGARPRDAVRCGRRAEAIPGAPARIRVGDRDAECFSAMAMDSATSKWVDPSATAIAPPCPHLAAVLGFDTSPGASRPRTEKVTCWMRAAPLPTLRTGT